MQTENLRLSPRLRRWTYATLAVLLLTGAAWWWLHTFGQVETEFGRAPHPAAPWFLRAHGAAAMLMLVLFGILLPVHLRRGWQAQRNRSSGVFLGSLCAILILTGWLLYYASYERLREFASLVHSWLGITLPVWIVGHIWLGRRWRHRAKRPT